FEKDYADDFKALFRGPRAFLNGEPLYDLAAIEANHLGNSYKYPPFFVLVMAPLTGIPFGPAIQLWRALNLACVLGAAWFLWRGGKQPLRSWSSLALLLLLLSLQPIHDSLRYGQVDGIIVLGVAAAYWALRRGRWGWVGVALALPIAMKLYPAFLLLHAGVRRRWRALLAAAVATAALTLLGIALLGWPVHATYLASVLPGSGGGTAWVENQTINGFLNRLGASSVALLPDGGGVVSWLTYLGALALAAWTARRSLDRDEGAGYGLWVLAMLIAVPISWIHYEALLLVPLFHIFVVAERRARPLEWRWVFVYALAWMLLAYGNQWTFFNRLWLGPAWALALSYKWYGLLLLWLALAYDPLFGRQKDNG
ncbi:MAG TPA: glycosyltransferase family 87 protein, partial [Herpetosiphonaceae bacterium]|nr:glycosyltransferase family 87 protein [Herpetosiphonaceae bacterium]